MWEIEELYLMHRQAVFSYLMSLTHDQTLAEDLLSETFLQAMRSLDSFRGDSSVRTWLCGIARNLWPVSYTHLDVYKRQTWWRLLSS